MKIALVALEKSGHTAARIARAHGDELTLIAPAEVAAQLGRESIWTAPVADWRAPGNRDTAAGCAFAALRDSKISFDEIRFDAKSGSGAVACAEARTGGLRLAKRLVVELSPGDEILAAPRALGETIEDRLQLAAVRIALRDCDAVEGDEAAKSALLAAGWELARKSPAPLWSAEAAPAVSAVITFYNLSKWLPACIDSLLAQTVAVEIVIVDDGSRPDEAALLDAQLALHPALRLVRQKNAGLSAARNAGIAAASHELILIVDADNIMRPRMVERLREALRVRPDASWACPAFRSFDDLTGETLFHYGPAELCDDVALLRNVIGDACALYRRSAFAKTGGFEPTFPWHPDWYFWLSAFEAGLAGAAVPEVLFDYRERRSSMLRAMSALDNNYARTLLLRDHPRFLARHVESVCRLQAAEDLAEAEYHRFLGKGDRDGEVRALGAELTALRGYASTLELELQAARAQLDAELGPLAARITALEEELAALRKYSAAIEEELAALRSYASKLEHDLAATQASLQISADAQGALRTELTKATDALSARDVQLDASREESALLQTRLLAALQRAHAAELARDEAELAKSEALQALDAMGKSSAVRASRLLLRASPTAHRAAGELLGALLKLRGR